MRDKKGSIEIGRKLVWIALAVFLIIIFSSPVFAAKADQYFVINNTCERFTDSVLWTAFGSKVAATTEYFNWTIGSPCPGTKSCDISEIFTFVRYIHIGATDPVAIGEAYAKLGNSTQNYATTTRYTSYLNQSIPVGDSVGPFWECGRNYSSNPTLTTCNTTRQGFSNITATYPVTLYAIGSNKRRAVIDDFNIRYGWCWIPLIYDANVSRETGGWGNTFNLDRKST